MADKPAQQDVRMKGFARRSTVADAFSWLESVQETLPSESVHITAASGRVLASEVVSQVNVPGFVRAMMDGYAVQAADTLGSSSYNRLALQIVGEVLPGRDPDVTVQPKTAVRIMTGAPLPAGADAVVPVEHTEQEADTVFILDALPTGKNVGRIGEDISAGATVLTAGRVLRPQDIGVLSSIGVSQVDVIRQPKVRIVVTGNELLPPGTVPGKYSIVDANSPMLAGLIARDGGTPINPGIIPDNADSILEAMQDDADVILVSGGSSVGKEDHAPVQLSEHGELAIHGIAMRPSSPAGMGKLGNRFVFLLPGNPVSCLCAYDFFAGKMIRMLGGRKTDWPYRSETHKLNRKLVSTVGRVDYARVKLADGGIEPLAISGASMLSSTTRADGFVIIPEDGEGYPPGQEVEVFLYD